MLSLMISFSRPVRGEGTNSFIPLSKRGIEPCYQIAVTPYKIQLTETGFGG